MATFKEAVDSGRPFRFDGKGSWFRYDKHTGRLINDDSGMVTDDLVSTFKALSSCWEIQEPKKPQLYCRAALMWHRKKQTYIEGREWFPQAVAKSRIHPDCVVVAWEEKEMPDLSLVFRP